MELKKYFAICMGLMVSAFCFTACTDDEEDAEVIGSVETSSGKGYITETSDRLVMTIDIKEVYVEKWTCDFKDDAVVKSTIEFKVVNKEMAKMVYDGLVSDAGEEEGEEGEEGEERVEYVLNGNVISADLTAQMAGAPKSVIRTAMERQLAAFEGSDGGVSSCVNDVIVELKAGVVSQPIPLPTHK